MAIILKTAHSDILESLYILNFMHRNRHRYFIYSNRYKTILYASHSPFIAYNFKEHLHKSLEKQPCVSA